MQVQARRRSMPPEQATGSAAVRSGAARPAGSTTYGGTGGERGGTTYGSGGTTYGGTGAGPGGEDSGEIPYGGGVYGSTAARGGQDGHDRGGSPKKPKGPGKGNRTKHKDPLWAKITVVLGALLMLSSGAVIVGTKYLIGRYTENISQQSLLDDSAQDQGKAPGKALEGAINILLLGVDERSRNPGDVRSDTIIVLHIPATHDQAYLVSVPRDTYVDVPAFAASKYPGGRSKITDAFHAGYQNGAGRPGGAKLVSKIITKMTGIRFNGAAIIDFTGFKNVIDALGGVTMCVDHQVESKHMRRVDGKVMWLAEARKYGGGKAIVHKKGCRKMEGWEALDYSRQRYGLPKGDYDRQRHQQQLIKAMAKQAMSKGVITDLGKLDRVIKAAGKAFVLDTGGVKIEDFIFTLKGVAANDLVLVKTNAGDFNSAQVDGTSAEQLSAESLEMFHSVSNGSLADWLVSHPNYVSKEK